VRERLVGGIRKETGAIAQPLRRSNLEIRSINCLLVIVAYEGKMKGTCSQTEADVRRTKMTDIKASRAERYQCIVSRLGAIGLIIIITILSFFSTSDQIFF